MSVHIGQIVSGAPLTDSSPLGREIKGVLFDVDGTLYYQHPVRFLVIAQLVLSHLFRPKEIYCKIKILRHYRRAQEDLRDQGPAAHNNRIRQIQRCARRSNASQRQVAEVTAFWFDKCPLRYLSWFRRRGLTESVRALHARGIVLGVFSDYPAQEKVQALGLSHCFAAIVSAHDADVPAFKPHPGGFLLAAARMGLAPEKILYIGDRPEVDGKGAAQADMQVALVRGFGRLAELEALLTAAPSRNGLR